MKGKLMNLLPFAHLPLYTIFAPKRLHNYWVLQSSQEKLKIKSLCKILGGKQGVSWEMCNWRMEIQNRKKARGGKWEGVYFFPFPFPSSPTRFFFLSPQAPLHYDTKRRQQSYPGCKRLLLCEFAHFWVLHPEASRHLREKTSGTKGIGWLIPTDISYRISSNNSRTSINRHPRIIARLEGIFNIIASLG